MRAIILLSLVWGSIVPFSGCDQQTVTIDEEPVLKATFVLSGLGAPQSEQTLQKVFSSLKGVEGVRIEKGEGKAYITYKPGVIPDQKIIEAVKKAGFSAALLKTESLPKAP